MRDGWERWGEVKLQGVDGFQKGARVHIRSLTAVPWPPALASSHNPLESSKPSTPAPCRRASGKSTVAVEGDGQVGQEMMAVMNYSLVHIEYACRDKHSIATENVRAPTSPI